MLRKQENSKNNQNLGEFGSDSDSDMSDSEEDKEAILVQYERDKKERRRRKEGKWANKGSEKNIP